MSAEIFQAREAARRFWPTEDPTGKNVRFFCGESWRKVIGVVGDVRHDGPSQSADAETYIPFLQEPSSGMFVVVRTAVDPLTIVGAVRAEVRALDRALPISRLQTMEQALAELIWKQRLVVIVLVTFAVLAVLLAAVGVYGVTSYAVAQRTHEVGVRLALGASTQDVLWQLLGQGMLIVVVGLALGLIGSLGLMRLIRSLLFGVEPTDATTLATVSLLLTGVTLVACYVPVRRATRIDPVTALRHE